MIFNNFSSNIRTSLQLQLSLQNGLSFPVCILTSEGCDFFKNIKFELN